MRALGLDLGTKTLGIAISDKLGLIASTYKTILFNEQVYDELLEPIKEIVQKENIDTIVLGFPKNMNNTIGPRATETLVFKDKLESFLEMKVILEDERWTSVQANNMMIKADMSRKKRKKVVDKLAATFILQAYLDKNRKGD
ncbi:MAG: Holliday junction resolvase RuvX [Bacilli bacterium]|nr:Holliday junction resolvase RuvX [Bacilli bacterium]MDD3304519.1 Holliday junction resolvase RuvX [Bacilli bacterium]MDD4053899.1 Holliday junction resolvase RuvX [Bacilli bacterium]MDD4411268.1 Holliday junction resolvase RuvX [Bacilli bacterium]